MVESHDLIFVGAGPGGHVAIANGVKIHPGFIEINGGILYAFRASRILLQRIMAEPKIEIIFNTVVSEIQSDENGVHSVSIKDMKTGDQWEIATHGFIFS